uniref:LCP family protein n=1 Tax=Acetatifactor sp. TaxID=1872090 RepID=UPI0040572150
MERDSGKDSIREMEQIQRGLEEFLDREVLNRNTTKEEINTMETIEEVDQKVTEEKMSSRYDSGRKPQFFTIGEEEKEERELDIISTKKSGAGTRRAAEADYIEDWDSPMYRSREAATKESSARRRAAETNSQRNKRSQKKSQKAAGKEKSHEARRGKKKKKSKFKRFLLTVAVLAVLLLGGMYYVVGIVYDKMNYHGVESVAAQAMKDEGVTNILLIGNDSRENGEDGRSDAMILLSISDKTKTIHITSLLRDMYVEIPGYKGNRLNAAYSFGGAELLMETVEQNLDIEVNRYMLVNFEAFAKLVDAVGGVELELTTEEIEYVNAYLVEYNMLTERPQGTDNMDPSVSGLVHLNGPQALAYTRNRYLGTDFGRTERQRKVLSAVIDRAPKALLTNPKGLIDGLLPNLTTNLTQFETFGLGLTAPKLFAYELVQGSLPIEGSYQNATIREMSVLEVDFEANKQYLRENVYGEDVIGN